MPIVESLLGGIGGALVGGLGSMFSGKQSADFSERAYKHRYQWQVKDLTKAGLNPMLAVGASPGSVPQPNFENIGEGMTRGYQAASSARLLAAQTEASQEQANLARAQGTKTMAESEAQGIQNVLAKASPLYQDAIKTVDPQTGAITGPSALASDRWNTELESLKATVAKLRTDTDVAKLTARLQEGNLKLQDVQIQYAPQLAKIKVMYEAAMAQAAKNGVPATAADAAFWDEAGPLGKFAVLFKSLIGK